ncbi:unnamed protein product [Paramecium sonneborni]|uniref:Uncharacterized protein n=1 Tax=Paramecium sonneborni TaxID=65129 RepID=A0A8S1KMY6_9CILI|nr:unnamed protein product [Paramecium sonneborni]
MNNLILNVYLQQEVKFKIAFDASGSKTFNQLKQIFVSRLEAFYRIAPQNIKEILPDNFDPSQYHLTDQTNFILSDQDIVVDLCSNNELINLVLNQSLSLIVMDPVKIRSSASIQQSQKTGIQPQQIPSIYSVQSNQDPQDTKPQTPPQQIKNVVSQPNQLLIKNQQKTNIFMDEADKNQLKQQFYLNTSKWNSNQLIMSDIEIIIRFLQAEDQSILYTMGCQLDDTLYNLSFKNILAGLPIISNLNQLHQKTVNDTINKLQNKVFYAIITKCSAGVKSFPKIDQRKEKNKYLQFIKDQKQQKQILKQHLFYNQNKKYIINLTFQQMFKLQIMEVNYLQIACFQKIIIFKTIQIQIQHLNQINQLVMLIVLIITFICLGLIILLNKVMKAFVNLDQDPKIISRAVRQYSNNNAALTLASACLFNKYRLNQNSRIAFEEGFLRLFFYLIISSSQIPVTFNLSSIFEYTRQWIQFLYDQTTKFNQVDIKLVEKYKKIDYTCWATLNPIKTPAFLSLNENEDDVLLYQIVDYNTILAKQQTEEIHSNGKRYSQ